MNKCFICGKGPKMAGERKKLRGKYNPVNWSKKRPNLQWLKLSKDILNSPILKNKKIEKELMGKRVKVCTQCLKSLHKTEK
jgi:ribosomal protein L28